MDALKILGQVMQSGALGSGGAQSVLGGLLGGGGGGRGGMGGLGGLGGGAAHGSSGGGMGMGKKAVMGALGGLAVAALMKHMKKRGQAAEAEQAGLGEYANHGLDDGEANSRAELMIRAMVGAAKADGRIDRDEESRLMERLGDLDHEERAFIQRELQREPDARDLARNVPRGMEQEVYAMSLMGIELDDKSEAQYLLDLASALGLSGDQCNQIHSQLGAPQIFN